MLYHTLLLGATLASAGPLLDSASQALPIPNSVKGCNIRETEKRQCYTAPGNTPQKVALDDVKFAANYLRSYGRQTKAGRLFTMNADDTPDCGEWSLYARGSVLITAKHLTELTNSSVLFEDIAATIDGGVDATAEKQAAALLGCGTDGGVMGVAVNATNPAYTSTAYAKLEAVTSGILIKVVKNIPEGQS